MNDAQCLAWLMSVGQQSMSDRNVDTVDGPAITAILDAAGSEHKEQAALAIQNLMVT